MLPTLLYTFAGAACRRRFEIPGRHRRFHLGGHLLPCAGPGKNLGPRAEHPPGVSSIPLLFEQNLFESCLFPPCIFYFHLNFLLLALHVILIFSCLLFALCFLLFFVCELALAFAFTVAFIFYLRSLLLVL